MTTQSPLLLQENSVYAKLLNDIANAVFVGGDRLVTTQLAKKYQTSINPVREAIKQLQGEGFVTVSPNSGASVAKFEYQAMRNVFELLQLLEPYLLSWFVETYTPQQMDTLYRLQEKMEAMEDDDFVNYGVLDTHFHWTMYEHHYNHNAVELWRKNRLILQSMHGNLPVNLVRLKQSIVEHRVLLEILETRNTSKAVKVLKEHISGGGSYWSKHYKI